MTVVKDVRLSVLDTAPVWQNSTPARALCETVELARSVDELGYLRYWVAEHHNAPFIASCAPPVLVAHLAAATTRLRVGSGGVMLPNHPPLVVAEQFGTLEAITPGRIDLGVGRSPGTDPRTAQALRRVSTPPDSEQFAAQLGELIDYFEPGEADVSGARLAAVPGTGNRPEVWLLGSSLSNARLAAALGLPFAYAHHIRPGQTVEALRAYRETFRPSPHCAAPRTLISVSVVAAETDERAGWLSGPLEVITLEGARGRRHAPNPTPEEAASRSWTAAERAVVAQHMAGHIIGGPRTIRERMADLIASTEVDEIMALTIVHGLTDRLRSYEILAAAFPMAPSLPAVGRPPLVTRR